MHIEIYIKCTDLLVKQASKQLHCIVIIFKAYLVHHLSFFTYLYCGDRLCCG